MGIVPLVLIENHSLGVGFLCAVILICSVVAARTVAKDLTRQADAAEEDRRYV
jgi:hypothetical protein